MDSRKTINFRIHHCRRDLNDTVAIIKEKLHGIQFDDLRKAITDSENLFSLSAEKYPPLPDFNMPQDYFDGNWGNTNINPLKYDNNEVLSKVKESIEKAGRRSDRFLFNQEFAKQGESLQKIIDILNSL
jgi:hypothetical protein